MVARTFDNLTNFLRAQSYSFYLLCILALAFVVRIANINYNSAFNDEAIYIVIGRMGLFASDWWSYGAKLWMAGLPFIYPTVSAMAYQTGGLLASRLLNIVFGVFLIEEVYRLVNLLNLYDKKSNRLAALLAAFIVAFSGIGIFVSKLATYDILSYLLLLLAINSFLRAENFRNGKYYFLTFLCLFMAYLTKIVIAIFIPPLFLISLLIMHARSRVSRKFALIYLYIPFFLGLLFYTFLNKESLITYISTHRDLGKAENYVSLFSLIWRETKIPLLLFLLGAIVFLKTGKQKILLALSILVFAVPAFHLAFFRYATFDKHLYLTVVFMSVVVGYGSSFLILNKQSFSGNKQSFSGNKSKKISKASLREGKAFLGKRKYSLIISSIVAIIYIFDSYKVLRGHELSWQNSVNLQNYLKENVKPGDKVLTEQGGAIVLALYDITFPPKNIVTFDWIDYSGFIDARGYVQAINDVYFDYIELDTNYAENNSLKKTILENLDANYTLAYQRDKFNVYEKKNK